MSRPLRPLFQDVSVTVEAGDRLGVVGINGTGKSTLLSVIAGTREPEGGTVRRGRGVTMAAVDQVTTLGFGSVRDAVGGGWRGEAALHRLGLADVIDRPVDQLSGGQEKRVSLAKALVADADLLVLDEPTNHLDIDAIEWLEHELDQFRGGLVIVTHDRYVLDRIATGYWNSIEAPPTSTKAATTAICRPSRPRGTGCSSRIQPSESRPPGAGLAASRGQGAHPQGQARIDRATEVINTELRPLPATATSISTHFTRNPRLGDQVIELHDVMVEFDPERPLITGLDLLLDRRERLGIVGANGSGKSTLLDVIAGRREPLAGRRVQGPTVAIGLHDQQGRDLDPQMRVRQAIAGDGAEPDWWDVQLLERFWFDSDAQKSPIELLSGGERRRLQLVLTLAAKPNVLLLDEPTNDLDLDTLRALEDFLDHWPGAVIVISHDRTFLDRTVDDVVVIDDGRARRWPGGYAGWLADREGATNIRTLDTSGAAKTVADRPTQPERSHRSRSTVRHELKTAEKDMARLEKRVAALRDELTEAGTDHEMLARVGSALANEEVALSEAEERWLERTAELEEIDGHA